MKKEEYNVISWNLINELQTPVAGSLEPQEFKKLQIDTVLEFIDLILEEYEACKKAPLDKLKKF
jgi:hypothetical protein